MRRVNLPARSRCHFSQIRVRRRNSREPNIQASLQGETGHAEVVQIEFDSSLLSYEELLQIFLRTHDPTTLNKQGYDEGTQYRSIILYHSDDQCETAKKVIQSVEAEKVYSDKIVTEIAPMKTFYSAEDHHQNYYNENPGDRYCTAVIRPKLSKFLKLFKSKAKADAEEVK